MLESGAVRDFIEIFMVNAFQFQLQRLQMHCVDFFLLWKLALLFEFQLKSDSAYRAKWFNALHRLILELSPSDKKYCLMSIYTVLGTSWTNIYCFMESPRIFIHFHLSPSLCTSIRRIKWKCFDRKLTTARTFNFSCVFAFEKDRWLAVASDT